LLPLTDVQWVLGHAHLSTTQVYLTPMPADVIAGVLAHLRRGQLGGGVDSAGHPAAGEGEYRRDSLDVLFGGRPT
jgi:hypothetical protein